MLQATSQRLPGILAFALLLAGWVGGCAAPPGGPNGDVARAGGSQVVVGPPLGVELQPVGAAGDQQWRRSASGWVLRVEGEAGSPWRPMDRDWRMAGAGAGGRDADGAWRIETPSGPLRVGPPSLVPPSPGAGEPILAYADGVLRLRRARRGDGDAPVVDVPVGQPQALRGAARGVRFGEGLAAMVDVDGDGDAELLVATRRVDEGGGSGSGLFLHPGSPGGLLPALWTWQEPGSIARAASILGHAGRLYVLTWPDPGVGATGPVTLRRFAVDAVAVRPVWTVEVQAAGAGSSWTLGESERGVLVGRVAPSGASSAVAWVDEEGAKEARVGPAPALHPGAPGFVAQPDGDCDHAAEGWVEHRSGWRACGGQVGGRFGHAVVAADFTGDGIDDVAISAPLAVGADGTLDVGTVRLWRGGGRGFVP